MNREILIKKMNYLARRRSTLELDEMLARIVDRLNWDELSGDDLQELLIILELDDLVLQKALLNRLAAPRGANVYWWNKILKLL